MSDIFAPKEIPVIKTSGLVLAMVLCASLLSACDCDGDCKTATTAVSTATITPDVVTPTVVTPTAPVVVTPTAPAAAKCADARFCKYDATGTMLDDSAKTWSCVQDKLLGNFWEVKTDDAGLRDKDWTYSKAGGAGACGGTVAACGAAAYATAVNAGTRPCGPARTCALPSHAELIYLALPADAFPLPDGNAKKTTTARSYAPNPTFFPEAIPDAFYFNSTDARQVNYAAVIPAGAAFNNLSDEGMAPPATDDMAGHIRLICK
jgi:hypothetical protein